MSALLMIAECEARMICERTDCPWWDEDGCLDEECFGNHMNPPDGWDRYAELNGVEEETDDTD